MDSAIEAAVRPELVAGERLLWTGRPNLLRLGWLRGGKTALFAIPWTGFAILWTGIAWFMSQGREDAEMFNRLAMIIGPVFILFGVWLFGYSLYKALTVMGTRYALTNRRAIVLTRGDHVRSFDVEQLGSLYRRGAHRGDIVFSDAVRRAGSDPDARTGSLTDYGFFGITDPRSVERLIRDQVRKA